MKGVVGDMQLVGRSGGVNETNICSCLSANLVFYLYTILYVHLYMYMIIYDVE